MTMASALWLSSCASRQNTTAATTEAPKQSFTSKLKKFPVVKLPKLRMPGPFFGPDIKIVEPREKDLKKLPSGSELAQAYRKKQRGFFWIVGGPINFEEPDLPAPGIDMGEDLLPPLPQ